MAQMRVLIIALLAVLAPRPPQVLDAARVAAAEPPARPMALLETGEFMELLMKPAYVDLRQAVARPPVDRKAWAAVYEAAIRLAETQNLLFFRDRKEASDPRWATFAAAVRQAAADVAAASVVSLRNLDNADYAAVREKYLAVSSACNACHKTFGREAPRIRP